MIFLIQTINGEILHDFVFILKEIQRYYNWWNDDPFELKEAEIGDIDNIKHPENYIPIGTVEFVSKYLTAHFPWAKESLKPLNVPECLFPFAGRKIANIYTLEDFAPFEAVKAIYCKSMLNIKEQWNGDKHADGPNGTWYEPKAFIYCQVSELIDIDSEWRVIVFNGEIQHVGNYSGDCLVFPDSEAIRNMVKAYGEAAPKAWTLDVAVTTGGKTVVLECHRFFSCGLYGFSDLRRIPKMYSQTWYEMIMPKNIFKDS